jgi:hypothetical protein
MLNHSIRAELAYRAPALFSGEALHRQGLFAAARGEYFRASRLFQQAARHYLEEFEVEALARLREHQAMLRALQASHGGDAVMKGPRRSMSVPPDANLPPKAGRP